jgi:hypothetical protein
MFTIMSTVRKGKYKNWEMGRIMRVKKVSVTKYELDIKVLELCFNSQGEEFVAKNDLTLIVKKEIFIHKLDKMKENDCVLVGYYSQSYRSENDNAYTINNLRALESIPAEDMDIMASSIWACKRDPIQVFESEIEINEYFQKAIDQQDIFS